MSSVQVQLSPSRNAKISFWVQLALVIFWIVYGGALLATESPTDDQSYLHIIFIILAFFYLIYILASYTPLFGIQAYLQVTPEYIVQKQGLFRPKLPIPFSDIEAMHLSSHGLHLRLNNGTNHYIDLFQINKKSDRERVKEEIRQAATFHDISLSQGPSLEP
jgi:uncharacterized membrane protein YobD (UPF0266 family)